MKQTELFDLYALARAVWKPTREAGLQRLRTFLPNSGRAYAMKRNYDFGSDQRTNVSLLSPWIRHRLIIEQEVLDETLKRHGEAEAEKFVQEVFWRTYFKGWLEHRPQVWSRYQSDVAEFATQLDKDSALRADYFQAILGRTGIACFDAWARELTETGYLHNHARMWFASIWIFTIGLPWQLGADFFYRHLLDGDPASNTLSWRWVAGLHTRGKRYLARAPNIERYTAGRFNPTGQLAQNAFPLSENEIGVVRRLKFENQEVDGTDVGLLITEEDCTPELVAVAGRPVAALGLVATDKRSPFEVSTHARTFAEGAVADGLARAAKKFGIETRQSREQNWGALLVDWAAATKIKKVLTVYPPVGPVAECLACAMSDLQAAGLELIRVMRPYDRLAWPHASKGYFGLKAKIPQIMKDLNVSSHFRSRS